MNPPNDDSYNLLPDWLADTLPEYSEEKQQESDPVVLAHLFGVPGDWYITSISSDRCFLYAYTNIVTFPDWEMNEWFADCSEWGQISIKSLQDLVDQKFNKEKDIRFLIARDKNWKPVRSSNIDLTKPSLNYPGFTSRNRA